MAKKNTITQEEIDDILNNSDYEVTHKVFGKVCVVVAQLPNGFTITADSACVDPENYDGAIGVGIAMKKIENKLWELEGFLLQNSLKLNA